MTGTHTPIVAGIGRAAAIALLCANVVVAAVALIQKWGYFELLLVYWCETVIIGFYAVAKLTVVALFGEPFGEKFGRIVANPGLIVVLFVIPFFVLKFGGFALTTGVFVLFAPAFLRHIEAGDEGGAELLAVAGALQAVGTGAVISIAALFISHGISFGQNFLWRREYKGANILLLLFWPYGRMLLMSFVLIVGLLIAGAQPVLAVSTAFTLLVVFLKLGVDLLTHLFEHSRLMGEASTTNRFLKA